MNLQQQNKLTQETQYNIDDYTDADLLDILDLNNPSDRELEAKIIFLIRKYQNMQNSAGTQLSNFFEKIYARFFDIVEDYNNKDDESDDIIEGFDVNSFTGNTQADNAALKGMQTVMVNDINGNVIGSAYITGNVFQGQGTGQVTGQTNALKQSSNTTPSTNTINYTKTLDYTPGQLNPLVNQTIKRVISIDSQYRDDKTSLSTNFTFNLTEHLKDVVSLKLYSIQIPYTWYTINNSFGSNFFYLKGATDGINNGNHDIEIGINPGNYSPIDLTSTINNSITTAKNNILHSDVNFGNTKLNYDVNTAKSTFIIDLSNNYNENIYYLNIPNWVTPRQSDISGRCTNIASYFGFEEKTYYPNTINSQQIYTSSTPNTQPLYTITTANNFFTVIKYNGPNEYLDISNNPGVIDISFNITLSNLTIGTTYSQSDIYTELNNQIQQTQYLSNESGILLVSVDPSNNLQNTYFFQLKIKPNRFTTKNYLNSKVIIQFPTETTSNTIWTTPNTVTNSCFGFLTSWNEMNNIIAEIPIITDPTVYTLSINKKDNNIYNPYIYLKCNTFDLSINDIWIDVSANSQPITNSSITNFMNTINTGISKAYNPNTNVLADMSNVLTGSNANIDSNNIFNLDLNIHKTFNENMYKIILDSNFATTFGFTNYSNISCNTPIIGNVSITTGLTISNTSICTISPLYNNNSSIYGNETDTPFDISINDTTLYDSINPSTTYTFIQNLLDKINNIFSNYTDTNQNILKGTTISYNKNVNLDGTNTFTLNVKINKTLVASDYSILFVDPSYNANKNNYYLDITTPSTQTSNLWEYYLNIDPSLCCNINNNSLYQKSFIRNNLSTTLPYPLTIDFSYNAAGNQILTINSSTVNINATKSIVATNLFNYKLNNNTFWIKAYEDGVASITGSNDISFSLPIPLNDQSKYNNNQLVNLFNTSISNIQRLVGTKFSIITINNNSYIKLRININKTYYASDYNIVFYDPFSFVKCFVGASSVQNTTWDGTLGWILGFHEYTVYYLSSLSSTTNRVITITGDTVVNTNLYNYFMLCLDDYNQSHLNDGLITISSKDYSIPLPSYASRAIVECDPVTNQPIYNSTIANQNYSNLTQNQLYSITQLANSKNSNNIQNGVITDKQAGKSYGAGPFVQDVFGLIPMKITGLTPGQSFVEYGGTLQNQDRLYFGPVNIRRMSVKLVSDRGDVVDLNGANWSFSLICETLNNLKPKI